MDSLSLDEKIPFLLNNLISNDTPSLQKAYKIRKVYKSVMKDARVSGAFKGLLKFFYSHEEKTRFITFSPQPFLNSERKL